MNPLKQLEGFTNRFKTAVQDIQTSCENRHQECMERFGGMSMLADIVEDHDLRIAELEKRLKGNDVRDLLKNRTQDEIEKEALDLALIDEVMKKEEQTNEPTHTN